MNRPIRALIPALVAVAGALYLASNASVRQAELWLVGIAAGVVLYHASFGFTSSWRAFIAHGRGEGVRAQMLMLAATCLVFFPALANGSLFGSAVRGSVAPAGLAVVIGAFMFGVGMQLGGGCASGTLFSVGGGSTRTVITLAAFIAGSVIATAHTTFWATMPAPKPMSVVAMLGVVPALVANLTVFAGIAWATIIVERRRHGALPETRVAPASWQHAWAGPWPMLFGALGLAAINIATLVLAGRPWGVTAAFALWGAKSMQMAGLAGGLVTWPYWSTPAQVAALNAPIANDVTSVMDVGIIVGALLASVLAGKFAPVWRIPARSLAAAVVGGLLLGYGARIASGCNIGAFFSGIASGSLHGWLWFAAAFAGNSLGTKLRPLFGMAN